MATAGKRRSNSAIAGFLRALRGSTSPLYEYAGIVAAPLEKVIAVLCDVRPGPISEDNAAVFYNRATAGETLSGGPVAFSGSGAYKVVEVDRSRAAISARGGYWFRGEYSAQAHGKDTRLIFRIDNIASTARWMAAFLQAQSHTAKLARSGIEHGLDLLGRKLGAQTYRED